MSQELNYSFSSNNGEKNDIKFYFGYVMFDVFRQCDI